MTKFNKCISAFLFAAFLGSVTVFLLNKSVVLVPSSEDIKRNEIKFDQAVTAPDGTAISQVLKYVDFSERKDEHELQKLLIKTPDAYWRRNQTMNTSGTRYETPDTSAIENIFYYKLREELPKAIRNEKLIVKKAWRAEESNDLCKINVYFINRQKSFISTLKEFSLIKAADGKWRIFKVK
jgi:lipopolysaccharide export LptBFGC system permease protein LptF